MRFIEFLPDLSFAYILWTVVGVLIAFVLWMAVYIVSRLIPVRFLSAPLDYLMAFSVFILIPFLYKRIFFSDFSISNFIGVNRSVIILVGLIIVAAVFWFIRKDLKNFLQRTLIGLNSRLTPLVWIFILLFICSLPFPFIKYTDPGDEYLPGEVVHDLPAGYQRPNIVLVVLDSLSSADMQLLGYEYPTTPFISSWAEGATVFSRYYSTSNWTSPAVMSMMTGQRPWTHRVWYQVKFHPVRNYNNNLPRLLRDYGYDVSAFVQNPYAHPETLGIEDAFMVKDKDYTFTNPDTRWVKKMSSQYLIGWPIVQEWIFKKNAIAELILTRFHPDFFDTLTPSEKVYNRFLDHIAQRNKDRSDSPFFAWLHLFPPHDPYLPPKPFMGAFGDSDKYISGDSQYSNFKFYSEYPDEDQAEINILRKRYDEYILYSDHAFKEFMSKLSDTIDISNTVFILTTDHGESFTHGYLTHNGPHLYEPLVRIPLVIKLPGQAKGNMVDHLVEQTDIAPTILDIASIPVPEWMEGRSFMSLLEGNSREQEPVFSMQLDKNSIFNEISKGTLAVWEGEYKLVHYMEDDRSLLFDLKSDPGETEDISEKNPDVTQRLLGMIMDNIRMANKKYSEQ